MCEVLTLVRATPTVLLPLAFGQYCGSDASGSGSGCSAARSTHIGLTTATSPASAVSSFGDHESLVITRCVTLSLHSFTSVALSFSQAFSSAEYSSP